MALVSVPTHYTPERRWPLLIALHGWGDQAPAFHDLWKPVTDSLEWILATPQGELEVVPGGWGWGDRSEILIKMLIDSVRTRTHVDAEKIIIAGFSQGGNVAYRMGLRYPHVFSGIVALGAHFDSAMMANPSPLWTRLKVYIGHGTLEDTFSSAQHAQEEMSKRGINVRFVPYEGLGHTIPEPKRQSLVNILSFWND